VLTAYPRPALAAPAQPYLPDPPYPPYQPSTLILAFHPFLPYCLRYLSLHPTTFRGNSLLRSRRVVQPSHFPLFL